LPLLAHQLMWLLLLRLLRLLRLPPIVHRRRLRHARRQPQRTTRVMRTRGVTGRAIHGYR